MNKVYRSSVAIAASRTFNATMSTAYIYHQLKSDEEVELWTEFCASCFAYKANPPPSTYFLRHFRNDPNAQPEHIFVARFAESNEIAASVRVFIKNLASNGYDECECSTIRGGGIGEVCTDASHRRKGLSNTLLRMAIDYMSSEHNSIQVSLLHADKAVRPVYEKVGYRSVRSRWTLVNAVISSSSGSCSSSSNNDASALGLSVREIAFPDDIPKLAKLHTSYSESRRLLQGCIKRSTEYWERYVAHELYEASGCARPLVLVNAEQNIIASLSLRIMSDNRCQMREFGMASGGVVSCGDALLILLGETLRLSSTSFVSFDGCVRLCLPGFVWNSILKTSCKRDSSAGHFDESSAEDDDDMGWMYRMISENDDTAQSYLARLFSDEDREGESTCVEHLVWPTDSF